jgi:chromosome segregation ATPase
MSLDIRTTSNAQPMSPGANQVRANGQLTGEFDRLKAALADSAALREQLESILRQRDEENRNLSSRLIDVQRQRDEAVSQLRQLESRAASLEARLAESSSVRAHENQQVEALSAEIESLRAEIESERQSADERRRALEAELAKLKTTLIAVQNEYARLRDDVAPAMAKAARHDRLMDVLPGWIVSLLLRLAGGKPA